MALRPKVCKNWTIMQSYLSRDVLYINDFHRSNSMAAQREVQRMSLRPYSRAQKLHQIEMLHLMATISKALVHSEDEVISGLSLLAFINLRT